MTTALPSGGLAVMQNRRDPIDSLDFFPTPPWATRALCEVVLPAIGLAPLYLNHHAWEPACGEGHMAEVLAEYFVSVWSTDVHPYGFGSVGSFVGEGFDVAQAPEHCDWIITNPPFNLAGEFVRRALKDAKRGVAMLTRTSWLDGGARYREIFEPHPPLAVAQFCERVPMVKGRWDPEASTATSYAWVVWASWMAEPETRFIWIPPGQRKALTRDDDVRRFTRVNNPSTEADEPGSAQEG